MSCRLGSFCQFWYCNEFRRCKALKMGCFPKIWEVKNSFSNFIVTNDENTIVKIRHIIVYIDGVENRIYLLWWLYTGKRSNINIRWNYYSCISRMAYLPYWNIGILADSDEVHFLGVWWPETWRWSSHQIKIPQKYNPIPNILKGILIILAILILLGVTFYIVILWPPRKIKEI